LPGWPESHVKVELTGADTLECICVTIHGAVHYLHSTTARELERLLHEQLDAYNHGVEATNLTTGLAIPSV
jgi:hypothetical protein